MPGRTVKSKHWNRPVHYFLIVSKGFSIWSICGIVKHLNDELISDCEKHIDLKM